MNFTAVRAEPLIPRYCVGEVTERMLSDGTEDTPLNVDELLSEARRLVEVEQVEGLVICFMHAYRVTQHEIEAKRILSEAFPNVQVDASHDHHVVGSSQDPTLKRKVVASALADLG